MTSTSIRKHTLMFAVFAVVAIGAFGAFSTIAHAQIANRTPLAGTLGLGSSGNGVTRLQTFLATNPSVYPQGVVSGYYGPLTQTAVNQFQIGYGLPAVGNVGPLTLAKINGLIAAGEAPDVDAPVISAIRVATTPTNATITWTTNQAALGRIHYDTAPIVMLETSTAKTAPATSGTVVSEQNYVNSHSLTIPNLARNTLYYYSLESTDVAGNVSVTLPFSLVTAQ